MAANKLQTYGCPVKGLSQPKYDRWAFAHYDKAKDAPPREDLFRQIADFMVPGWFEWHPWTLRMVKAYCSGHRWIGMAGCSGCVSGDTRILMGDTGEQVPIEYLCSNGIAPMVMTLNGPRQATIPWIKGEAQLFRVVLSNGSDFQATSDHRVLVRSSSSGLAFSTVGSLSLGQHIVAYDPTPLASTSELGLSTHGHVVSITATRKDIFYDISVPGVEHYFAEGAIHHNSSKTRHTVGIACLSWLCAPHETSVQICSTTMKMLRKRAWAEVRNFAAAIEKRNGGKPFGHMIDSETVWQSTPGENKHCIFGKAVGEGNVEKAAADIQGNHTRRQIIILDEADAVLAPIWTALINLYAFPDEFCLIAPANPRSRLSKYGRFIEPLNGYDSITLDTEEWEAKPYIDGTKPLVLRFDFLKSPRIENPSCSKYLPNKQKVNQRMNALRLRGGENDPEHLCFDRAFPAPDGLNKTVFASSTFTRVGAHLKHSFTGDKFNIIGVFDPARTGDRPAVRFGAMGDIGGRMGIEWMDPITLFSDSSSIEGIAFQFASQIKDLMARVKYRGQERSCGAAFFGADCTGDGANMVDVIDRELGAKIIRIQFQSSASKSRMVSQQDQRPCDEKYLNKRAEMWYGTNSALESGQIKGVDLDTVAELCEMRFGFNGLLIKIEDKKDYKKRVGVSPDYADTGIMLTEVAMQHGFVIDDGTKPIGLASSPLDDLMKRSMAVYSDVDYGYQSPHDVYAQS